MLAADDAGRAVVQVAIDTGRTHQIRVHLAHAGCPVLGDPVYGDAYATFKDQSAMEHSDCSASLCPAPSCQSTAPRA